ncbi:hypothetical protein FHG87_024877 [Trinorchestia longiramus]|nr:hypothetical protein FHG87_024877 [Trinorchestia longiramus]
MGQKGAHLWRSRSHWDAGQPADSFSQTIKSAAEETIKSTAEETIKSAAEETIKSAAEETIKSAAEETIKSAAEETIKSATEKTVSVAGERRSSSVISCFVVLLLLSVGAASPARNGESGISGQEDSLNNSIEAGAKLDSAGHVDQSWTLQVTLTRAGPCRSR